VVTALVLGLVAPGTTAGAFTLERERQTLEALLVTPFPRRSLVLGKLWAALLGLGLVTLSALPVAGGVCMIVGGVAPGDVALTFVYLAAYAGFTGALGLWCSTWVRGTAGAIILAYMASLFVAIGTVVVDSLVDALSRGPRAYGDPPWLSVLSPVFGAWSIPGTTDDFSPGGYWAGVEPWVISLPFYVVVSALLVLWTIARVSRMDAQTLQRGNGMQ